MADIIDSSWNPNDEANTGVAPDGVQGGYAPSTVAPIIRAIRGAVRRSYEQINPIFTSTGSANAYALTYPIAPAKLTKGIIYAFWANHTNTGAATLNINGLGAKAITSSDKNALVASQILADTVVTVVYDGSAFRMIAASTVNPKFTGMTTLENLTVTGTTNAQATTATSITVKGGNVNVDSDANRHITFRNNAGSTTALVYNHSASNNLYLRSYALTGDTFNEVVLQPDGQLILPTAPTIANAAVTKTYADTKLALTGGTVTGETSFNNKLSARQGTNAAQSFPISLGWSNAASTHWNMVLETNGSLTFANYNPANGAWKSSPITLNADGTGVNISGDIRASSWVYSGSANLRPDGNISGGAWGGMLSDYINSRISSNTNGNMAGRAYPRRSDGAAINFAWSGQGGQPTWLWGGSDGTNMYVYDPRNFSVNYANSTWNSERLQGWDIAGIQNDAQNRANDRGYWGTRDYLNSEAVPVGQIVYMPHGNISGKAGDVRGAGGSSGTLFPSGSYQAMQQFSNGGTINWKRVG
ncbi:hypothetical protein [Brucella anthropi]|uniref:hypothetical protein n=1 Tax=Brucella anthropi TaxID=529 RepID=UPI0021661556|nr:hypothetical protein [Brucella anthropi]UVV67065.1 hypothetical protein NW321_11395 [Brucella anthropi]